LGAYDILWSKFLVEALGGKSKFSGGGGSVCGRASIKKNTNEKFKSKG